VRVGTEATEYARRLERLLAELNFERWVGEAAQIRVTRVRKQTTGHASSSTVLCHGKTPNRACRTFDCAMTQGLNIFATLRGNSCHDDSASARLWGEGIFGIQIAPSLKPESPTQQAQFNRNFRMGLVFECYAPPDKSVTAPPSRAAPQLPSFFSRLGLLDYDAQLS
jgi:hypothetical protein